MKNNLFSNRIYWKISLTLLALLVILGIVYVAITVNTEKRYFQEVNQRLYGSIADHTIKEVKPLIDGEVDTNAIQEIMHSMMVINPNVEVYLLDQKGKIITYVAPYKKVKLQRIDLEPVKTFINASQKPFIQGDDPRNPGEKKVFSAAPIMDGENLEGYVYIILASEEQAAVTSSLYSSRMIQLSSKLFFFTLFGAMAIGLLALWYITRNLRTIIDTVRRFKEGDYQARIPNDSKGDLTVLADTFNEMADQIVANIEQIKSVENLRRELIGNVSHDLRTPLAIMQGYIETLLLKDKTISEKDRRQYLEIVLSSSEKLSHLVSQLFEYSKLEANQIQPEKEPFFIAELAQDVFQKYQILAADKHINLQLKQDQNLPLVFADLGLVERAMQNLIDNALKFTPSGGNVTLELIPSEKHVEVRIADTGPGIPEAEQIYIFERYRQAKQLKTDAQKGAGLGLAIAKKIMELHNSALQVKSRPNEGATFFFKLPTYMAS